MNYNQKEIDSFDQKFWRDERIRLYNLIQNFCARNNATFYHSKLSKRLVTYSSHDTIVFMLLFDQIPNFTFWNEINEVCQTAGKRVLVLCDNVIDSPALEFVEFFGYPKLLGVTASYTEPTFPADTHSRLYNCFIQRVDSVRQSWFYFLKHHNLLDQGYVSYLLKSTIEYSTLTGQELFDWIHTNYQLNGLPKFEQAYQELKNLVPYRNFEERGNLIPEILNSKYSLILETYALDDDFGLWCFTEKSLRTLQFPTIPLLFMQRNSIKVLKSLGFEVGNHLDELDSKSWHQRQQDLLTMLVEDSVDYRPQELYNQSLHNRQLLQTWKTEYQHPEFFDEFFNKVITS
jgi:hypothetical protein